MDHSFGCAFTRQSPVETEARSLSSKWFAPPRPSREALEATGPPEDARNRPESGI
jgi:hypothetical protein